MSNRLTSIAAEFIELRPAVADDREKIFRWLTQSGLTSSMFGPPVFPDVPVPTREEFDADYVGHYFDGTQPLMGRCFIIISHGMEAGQINYNAIDMESRSTEMDIWLAGKEFSGKGLGPAALNLLCEYLEGAFGCTAFYIAPSRRNERALKAYRKADFAEASFIPDFFVPDYQDAVLMVRYMNDLKSGD